MYKITDYSFETNYMQDHDIMIDKGKLEGKRIDVVTFDFEGIIDEEDKDSSKYLSEFDPIKVELQETLNEVFKLLDNEGNAGLLIKDIPYLLVMKYTTDVLGAEYHSSKYTRCARAERFVKIKDKWYWMYALSNPIAQFELTSFDICNDNRASIHIGENGDDKYPFPIENK